MTPSMTRREFLQKSLSGTGLVIAVSISPFGTRLLSAAEMEKQTSDLFSPSVWLRITPDNVIHAIINKSEMGQGVFTSLPMILVDELDADWNQIRVTVALAGDQYKDPIWGAQSTGGSSSIRHMFDPLRKAGAAAREMLITAASQTWGVPPGECTTFQGTVKHLVKNKVLSFGQLSIKASALPVPHTPSLKQEDQYRIIGHSIPRLDIHDKVNGSAAFGIDSFVPGMLYATVERSPAYGAKAIFFDRAAALSVQGVRHVVLIDRGIAVCAETPEAAWKGRTALNARWEKSIAQDLNNESLEKMFLKDLDKKGVMARNDGDVKTALDKAAKKIEATYILPYLSHATMEPMNCTAHVGKDLCEIWVPTQNQSGVLQLAQKQTGLRPEQISVHTTYLGGGFGRRFELDVVEEAVEISKAFNKPVKLLWKREEDIRNDFYRPGNCSKIEAGLDVNGRLVAWAHKIVCPSIFSRVFPGQVKNGIDPAAVEGLKNMEYEIPNVSVEYIKIDTPVPVGFWRSVGSSHNAFTVESFVDEMAHVAGKDPLEFRMNLLMNHRRAYRVLEVAAKNAGWGKPLTAGRGRGIAQHFSFESYVAHVAEVSVDRKSGMISVHRVVCAVDSGPVVNPAIVTAQMEGGIIMGLSAAMKERIDFAHGGVETSNFDNYPLLRMSEIPDIEVHIVKNSEKLGGIGEPGVPPIAPAVANAVFNACGIRLRRLPMRPEAVLEAMR